MEKPAYSQGFRDQENEIIVGELSLEGRVPEWLSGSLIRTAPSKFKVGKTPYRHWFDGLAMLHKFTFRQGKVAYASKFLQSNAYLQAREKGRIVYGEFGTDPCRDLFQKVASIFRKPESTDNGCVNINLYGQQLAAATETPKPIIFKTESLESLGPFYFQDQLKGQNANVHPHYDQKGTLFGYLTEFAYKSSYHVYSMPAGSKKRNLIASLKVDEPAYMHSLGMTENYIILTEFPLLANVLKLRFANKPFIESYEWKPEKGCKIHLVEKSSGKIQSFETESFFAFHHVNAFEQYGDVIFDIVAYQDAEIINQLYLHRLRSGTQIKNTSSAGKLMRYCIDLKAGKVSAEKIADGPIELPRINYARVNTRPYKYVYGAGITIAGDFLDNISKINVCTGKENVWYREYCYPGEPVFVQNPAGENEDDGILLSIVLDAMKQTSFLLVLNARNLKEIARAQVPQHITFGFHGQYVPFPHSHKQQ